MFPECQLSSADLFCGLLLGGKEQYDELSRV